MATVTVKNIPEEVYRRLKETAQKHRRSINSEIIVCLESNLVPVKVRVEEVLVSARRLREKVAGTPFSSEEIREARHQGRP